MDSFVEGQSEDAPTSKGFRFNKLNGVSALTFKVKVILSVSCCQNGNYEGVQLPLSFRFVARCVRTKQNI